MAIKEPPALSGHRAKYLEGQIQVVLLEESAYFCMFYVNLVLVEGAGLPPGEVRGV